MVRSFRWWRSTAVLILLGFGLGITGFAHPLGSEPPSGNTVLPAQTKPEGMLRRIQGGPVLGGRPDMPAQYRRTRPEGVRVQTVLEDLRVPWDMTFTKSGNTLYFTERRGRLWKLNRTRQPPAKKLVMERAEVLHWGEGGLMGIALHPRFQQTGWIYLSETYGSTRNPHNRILRLRRSPDRNSFEVEVLIDRIPAASYHNGSRLAFGPDGYLYATTGDAGRPSSAQDRSSWAGKILRMTPDGRPVPGNPFQGEKATPYVYSYGHRNPQGLAWHPESGQLYASEHGPSGEFGLGGNDEVNRIVKGANYGWPKAVGAPGLNSYRDPMLLFPDPHLPPAGMAFYRSALPHPWNNDLFVASLRSELLLRVIFDPEEEVSSLERWFERDFFEGEYGRIRAVQTGPDGGLFIATSNRDGRGSPASNDDRILRLTPAD